MKHSVKPLLCANTQVAWDPNCLTGLGYMYAKVAVEFENQFEYSYTSAL